VVCKRLVELMGGDIGAASTVGKGSLFWIDLNLTRAPQSDAGHGRPAITGQTAVLAGARVDTLLYVEDNPANLMLVEDLMARRPGIRLLSAMDGQTGVAVAKTSLPDVVLMDINLPGMSGIECVRQLKPLLPKTQFVMLTVYEDADHIYNALTAGASGYLLKQTPRSELLAALRDVHAGGSPMTSNIARKVVQSFQLAKASAAEDLSPREREVLELKARGYLYKENAYTLGISVPTVNTYIRRIYEKLHVRSRGQAVAKYNHQPVGDERARSRPQA